LTSKLSETFIHATLILFLDRSKRRYATVLIYCGQFHPAFRKVQLLFSYKIISTGLKLDYEFLETTVSWYSNRVREDTQGKGHSQIFSYIIVKRQETSQEKTGEELTP
jgi:hypothetical protein